MADTNLQAIKDLPDVSFIDNLSLEDVQNLMITTYQDKYEEITGKKVTLLYILMVNKRCKTI